MDIQIDELPDPHKTYQAEPVNDEERGGPRGKKKNGGQNKSRQVWQCQLLLLLLYVLAKTSETRTQLMTLCCMVGMWTITRCIFLIRNQLIGVARRMEVLKILFIFYLKGPFNKIHVFIIYQEFMTQIAEIQRLVSLGQRFKIVLLKMYKLILSRPNSKRISIV
jgi:hypothetical protein